MKYYKEDERGQGTASEVTKQWKREGYEEGLVAGIEKERKKTKEAEKRAKAAEARAQAAEEELARLKSMMQ